MRKLYIITGMLLALAISAHGQVSNPSIVPTASNPTGNACTAGVPMLYYAGTYYGCDGTGHYAAVGASAVPVTYWNRLGTLFSPRADLASDQKWVYEPNVIYEGSPQYLTGYTGTSLFKLMFTCGSGSPGLCYGETVDGIFGQRNTALTNTSGLEHSCWMNDSGTYRLFGSGGAGFTELTSNVSSGTYTSLGIVLPVGTAGQWDTAVGNCNILKVSSTYYLFYDGNSGGSGACGSAYCEGYATSTDGVAWIKKGKVIDYGTTAIWTGGGHPDVHYIPSLTSTPWVMFFHNFFGSSDLWMATAASPDGPWSTTPYMVMRRQTPDEGEPAFIGNGANLGGLAYAPQIADTRLIEVNDAQGASLCPGVCTWMFYDSIAYQNGAGTNEFHIKTAFTHMPLKDVVTAVINGNMLPSISADPRSIQVSYDYQAGHFYSILPFYQMTRTTSNTDLAGKLTFSGTTASYSFSGLYGVAPLCFIQAINPTGSLTYKVTTLSTSTLTITASGASTDTVAYQCVGQY